MKRKDRKKDHKLSVGNGVFRSINDARNTSKSKEQMKKDWGSKRATMNRKLSK